MLQCMSPEWWCEELQDRGWRFKDAKLFEHYLGLLLEQVAAVVPISVLLVVVMGAAFGVTVTDPLL